MFSTHFENFLSLSSFDIVNGKLFHFGRVYILWFGKELNKSTLKGNAFVETKINSAIATQGP